ncbi:MAG: biotin/lipoyl-binding protein, partial [Pyrinomonadaceae bacterium]
MMRNRKYIGLAAAAVLSALVFAACGRGGANSNASSAQPSTIDVTTTQAVVKQIPTYFEATGNLAGDAQTDVAPVVGGKIVEVNFDVGSYVTKGSVLVRMDDRDARIRVEQALAQVEQQKKAVGTAIAALRQAQIRLNVKD